MPDVTPSTDEIFIYDQTIGSLQKDRVVSLDSESVSDISSAEVTNSLLPTNVRALTSTRIRVDFSNNVIQNEALTDSSSYQISPVSAGASLIFPQEVILPIGQATPSFVEIEITEMTDSAVYSLSIVGLLESVDGEPASPSLAFFAGSGDAPEILLVVATSKNSCEVRFTEPMLDNSAIRNVNNYSFDGGLSVTSVVSVQGSIVTLATTDQTEGFIYNLTVRGLLSAKINDQITAPDQTIESLNDVGDNPFDTPNVSDGLGIQIWKPTIGLLEVILEDFVDHQDTQSNSSGVIDIDDSISLTEEASFEYLEYIVIDIITGNDSVTPQVI